VQAPRIFGGLRKCQPIVNHPHKFRTMIDQQDAQGNQLSNEQRLTRLGKFLRSTTLDELPELINMLRGEMSLVGPRPLLEYSPTISVQ